MTELDRKLIADAGLNSDRIAQHAERVRAALANTAATTIPVVDGCTVNNGHVISWTALEEWVKSASRGAGEACFAAARSQWLQRHLVTAIPAAGAASRFLGEFQKFVLLAESQVPDLKALADAFAAHKTDVTLSDMERENMATALLKVAVPESFKTVPEILLMQDFPELRLYWMRLNSFLLDLLESGALTEETLQALVVSADENPRLREKCGEDVRRPWSLFAPQIDAEGLAGEFAMGDDHVHSEACGGASGCGHDHDDHEEFEYDIVHFYAAARALVDLYGGVPKALVPTTNEGDTFLRLKLVEQISLLPCAGNVLIVPAGQVESVRSVVEKEGSYLRASYANVYELAGTPFAPEWLRGTRPDFGRWTVVEQGRDLSTIRFNLDGSPALDNGKYSVVAAGHGELVHLFEGIAREFPQAECLHVRNIDNVVGASRPRVQELGTVSDSFRLVRDAVEFLRDAVDTQLASDAKNPRITSLDVGLALEFLASLLSQEAAEAALEPCIDEDGEFVGVPSESLYEIMGSLFHWPHANGVAGAALWKPIAALLARPLSVFGVVRKEDGDVGGGPVLVKTPDGQEIKICLEMPHADAKDSKTFFGPGGKATHFNPVLAYFELRTHTKAFAGAMQPGKICDFRRLFDDRFWMLSRKDFQGKSVCYHETVLYELIGNSATTNLIFVEVPRTLFHPHKTMFDSLGRMRESYGFHETLGEPEVCGEES